MTEAEYTTVTSPERERFLAEIDDPLISKKTVRALRKWTNEHEDPFAPDVGIVLSV